MRILTVRQPWAWAIIHGGKDVENRVRNIAGDYRGPVAIHVAQEIDTHAVATPSRMHPSFRAVAKRYMADNTDPLAGSPWMSGRGHIIGVVDLVAIHGVDDVGCMAVIPDCSPWAEKTSGIVHLRLADPRSLVEPIPYRGALGLRRLDDDATARILAQIERHLCPECRDGKCRNCIEQAITDDDELVPRGCPNHTNGSTP